MNRTVLSIAGAGLALALSGCGGSDAGAAAAASAAAGFAQAVADSDGSSACAMLSEQTVRTLQSDESERCAEAILEQDLPGPAPLERIERQGRSAFVVTGSDTVFLSQFPDGWKIIGVGCTERGEAPYDCTVSGG